MNKEDTILTLRRECFREAVVAVAVKMGRASLARVAEKERVIEEIATENVDEDNGGVTVVEDGGVTEWWVRGVWGWLAAGGVQDWRGERGERGEGGSRRGERWA